MALIAAGLIFGSRRGGTPANFSPIFSTSVPSMASHPLFWGPGVAASKALFCYDAWSTVTFAASEIRDPQRNLPRALVMGTVATTLTYVGRRQCTSTCSRCRRWRRFPKTASQHRQPACCSAAIPEPKLIAAAILVSTFGCINGMILGGARVLYAMAGDGLFWRGAAQLNSRRAPGGRCGSWRCGRRR